MATEVEAQEAADEKEVQVEAVDLGPVHMQSHLDNKLSSTMEIKNAGDIINSAEGMLKIPEDQVLVEAPSVVKLPPEHNLNGTASLNDHIDQEEKISNDQLHENKQKDHEEVEAALDGTNTDQCNRINKDDVTDCLRHGESTIEDNNFLKHEKEEEPEGDDHQDLKGVTMDDDTVKEDTLKIDNAIGQTFDGQQDKNLESASATDDTQPASMADIPNAEVVAEAPAGVQTPVEHNLDGSDATPDTIDGNTETEEPAKANGVVHLDHKESFPEDTSIAEPTEEVVKVEDQQSKKADAMDADVVQEQMPKCDETVQEEMPKSEHADESTTDNQEVLNQESAEETNSPVNENTEETAHQSEIAAPKEKTSEHDATMRKPAINIQVRNQEALEEMEGAEAAGTEEAMQQSNVAFQEAIQEDHVGTMEPSSDIQQAHNVESEEISGPGDAKDDVTDKSIVDFADHEVQDKILLSETTEAIQPVLKLEQTDNASDQTHVVVCNDRAQEDGEAASEPQVTEMAEVIEATETQDINQQGHVDSSKELSTEDDSTASETNNDDTQGQDSVEIKDTENAETHHEETISTSEKDTVEDDETAEGPICASQEVENVESTEKIIENIAENEVSDVATVDEADEEANMQRAEDTDKKHMRGLEPEETKNTEPVETEEASDQRHAAQLNDSAHEDNTSASEKQQMESAIEVTMETEASKTETNACVSEDPSPENNITESETTCDTQEVNITEASEAIEGNKDTKNEEISEQSNKHAARESIQENVPESEPTADIESVQEPESEEMKNTELVEMNETSEKMNATVFQKPAQDDNPTSELHAMEIAEQVRNIESTEAQATPHQSNADQSEEQATEENKTASQPQILEPESDEEMKITEAFGPQSISHQSIMSTSEEYVPEEKATEDNVTTEPDVDHQQIQDQESAEFKETEAPLEANKPREIASSCIVSTSEDSTSEDNATATEPSSDTQAENLQSSEVTENTENANIAEEAAPEEHVEKQATDDISPVQEPELEETKDIKPVGTEDSMTPRDLPVQEMDMVTMETEEIPHESPVASIKELTEDDILKSNAPHADIEPVLELESVEDMKCIDTTEHPGEIQKIIGSDEPIPTEEKITVTEQTFDTQQVQTLISQEIKESEDAKTDKISDLSTIPTPEETDQESNTQRIETIPDVQQVQELGSTEETRGTEAVETEDYHQHHVSALEEPPEDSEPNADDQQVNKDKPAEVKDTEAMEAEEVFKQSDITAPDNACEERSELVSDPELYVLPAQQVELSRDSEDNQLVKVEETISITDTKIENVRGTYEEVAEEDADAKNDNKDEQENAKMENVVAKDSTGEKDEITDGTTNEELEPGLASSVQEISNPAPSNDEMLEKDHIAVPQNVESGVHREDKECTNKVNDDVHTIQASDKEIVVEVEENKEMKNEDNAAHQDESQTKSEEEEAPQLCFNQPYNTDTKIDDITTPCEEIIHGNTSIQAKEIEERGKNKGFDSISETSIKNNVEQDLSSHQKVEDEKLSTTEQNAVDIEAMQEKVDESASDINQTTQCQEEINADDALQLEKEENATATDMNSDTQAENLQSSEVTEDTENAKTAEAAPEVQVLTKATADISPVQEPELEETKDTEPVGTENNMISRDLPAEEMGMETTETESIPHEGPLASINELIEDDILTENTPHADFQPVLELESVEDTKCTDTTKHLGQPQKITGSTSDNLTRTEEKTTVTEPDFETQQVQNLTYQQIKDSEDAKNDPISDLSSLPTPEEADQESNIPRIEPTSEVQQVQELGLFETRAIGDMETEDHQQHRVSNLEKPAVDSEPNVDDQQVHEDKEVKDSEAMEAEDVFKQSDITTTDSAPEESSDLGSDPELYVQPAPQVELSRDSEDSQLVKVEETSGQSNIVALKETTTEDSVASEIDPPIDTKQEHEHEPVEEIKGIDATEAGEDIHTSQAHTQEKLVSESNIAKIEKTYDIQKVSDLEATKEMKAIEAINDEEQTEIADLEGPNPTDNGTKPEEHPVESNEEKTGNETDNVMVVHGIKDEIKTSTELKVEDDKLPTTEQNAVDIEAMQENVDKSASDDILQLETEENAFEKTDETVSNEKTEASSTSATEAVTITEDITDKASEAHGALLDECLKTFNDTGRDLNVSSVTTASKEESMSENMEDPKLVLPADPAQDESTPKQAFYLEETERNMSLSEKLLPTEPEEQDKNQIPNEQDEEHMQVKEISDAQKEVEQDLPVSNFLMNLILGKENGNANGNSEFEDESKQQKTTEDSSCLINSKQEESLVSLPAENKVDEKITFEQEKHDVKYSEETHEMVKEQSHDLKLDTERSIKTDEELNKKTHDLETPAHQDNTQDEISGEMFSEEAASVATKMETRDIKISNIELDDSVVETICEEDREASTTIENGSLKNNLNVLTNTKACGEDTLGEGQTGLLHEFLPEDRSADTVSEQTHFLTENGMTDAKVFPSDAESVQNPVCAKRDEPTESSNIEATNTPDLQLEGEEVDKKEEKQHASTATCEVSEEHVESLHDNLQKSTSSEATSDKQAPQITEPVSDTEMTVAHDNEISEGSTCMDEKENSNFSVKGVETFQTAVEAQTSGTRMKINQDKQDEVAYNETAMEPERLGESNFQEHQESGTKQKSPKESDDGDYQFLVKKEAVIKHEDMHETVESHTQTVNITSSEEQEMLEAKVQERDLNVVSPKEAPDTEENFVDVTKKEFSTDEEQSPKADESKMAGEKTYDVKTKDEGEPKNSIDEEVKTEAPGAGQKAAHKKHNLLSGVGSKVKHQLAKVKKAIVGKPGHTKPESPKA